tara:strand:+ start:147 stop:695 length:549 start_codon:yes stop_codon:yes gene_type:complete
MHKYSKIYYFIDDFDIDEINKLNKNISLIYRNYKSKCNIRLIKKIRNFCFLNKRKFYISNNIKIAKYLRLDGVYIPSFNKLNNFKNLNVNKDFTIIGSAHNKVELINKKNQGCIEVFIVPIFKTNKSNFFLDIIKFNLLTLYSGCKIIALGGINKSNYSKLRLLKLFGIASISWIKKTGLIT